MLARRSHRVALVRPARTPAGALAESLPPSARRVLAELGALEAVDAAGLFPNRGNSVWWAREPARHEVFADGAEGVHTDRAALEAVLAGVAERTGATVHEGYTARKAAEDSDGWTVRCEASADGEAASVRGAPPIEIAAPWVIDATGRHGFLARSEGREADRDTTTLAIVRRWRRPGGWPADEAHLTFVESHDSGWAWSVPLDRETRCFTAMVDQRRVDLGRDDLNTHLDEELAQAPRVAAGLAGAEPVGEAWACPASLYTSARFARPGLLLAGDAGSFIDPLSSFGVKKALSSGWLAGIVVHSSLVDPSIRDTALEFFDARERQVYGRYRRASAEFFEAAARAHGSPYWTERATAARAAGSGDASAGGGQAAAGNADASAARTGTNVPFLPSDGPVGAPGERDPVDALGADVPEGVVRTAFEGIRARERLSARPGSTLRSFRGPAIEGHRIVLQDRLATAAWPAGIRFVHGVDLTRLVEVAPRFGDVPDGWGAYNGVAPPVTLPDYLTALATAFAIGVLEHAD